MPRDPIRSDPMNSAETVQTDRGKDLVEIGRVEWSVNKLGNSAEGQGEREREREREIGV